MASSWFLELNALSWISDSNRAKSESNLRMCLSTNSYVWIASCTLSSPYSYKTNYWRFFFIKNCVLPLLYWINLVFYPVALSSDRLSDFSAYVNIRLINDRCFSSKLELWNPNPSLEWNYVAVLSANAPNLGIIPRNCWTSWSKRICTYYLNNVLDIKPTSLCLQIAYTNIAELSSKSNLVLFITLSNYKANNIHFTQKQWQIWQFTADVATSVRNDSRSRSVANS